MHRFPSRRALILWPLLALLAGGCGTAPAPHEPPAEAAATITTPLWQTEYTAVQFLGSHGWLAGYRQELGGTPVKGSDFVLRTQDAGRTWRRAALGSWQVSKIDFVAPRLGFLAATDPDAGSAVLRSTDGGRNWYVVVSLPSDPLRLHFFDARRGFVLSAVSLDFTDDGGNTWQAATLPAAGAFDVDFATPLEGWAIAGGAIYQTTDGARTWHMQYQLPPALAQAGDTATGGSLSFRGEAGWAAFALAPCTGEGCPNVILHTADGGATWQVTNASPSPLPGILAPADPMPGPPQRIWALGAQDAVWNGAAGLLETQDGGGSWTLLGAPSDEPAQAFDAVSGVRQGDLWAVDDSKWGGSLLHRVAGRWRQVLPQPFPVSAVDFVSAKVGFGIGLAWDDHAVVGTRDGGRHWTVLSEVAGGLPVAIAFTDPVHGYIAYEGANPEVLRTTDGGRSWSQAARMSGPATALSFWTPKEGVALGETAAGWPPSYTLWSTVDSGRTWRSGPVALPNKLTHGIASLAAVGFAGPRSGYLFALRGGLPLLWQLSGAHWQTVAIPQAPSLPKEHYAGAGTDLSQGGGIWIALQPVSSGDAVRVIRSQDGGVDFTSHDLPLSVVTDVPNGASQILSAVDAQHAFLLTNLGLLATEDGGLTWKRLP